MSDTEGGGRRRGGLFDDIGGMAGGAFSVLAGLRAEAEAMARAQTEAVVQRLELVRREELDAALEVARRAREQAEALEARVAALEARLGGKPESPAPQPAPTPAPEAPKPGGNTDTSPDPETAAPIDHPDRLAPG